MTWARLCLCWGVLFSHCVVGSADDLKTWFLKEAPNKWAEYREKGKRLQASYLWTVIDREKRIQTRERIEFKQNANCALFVQTRLEAKDKLGLLFAVNAKYAFSMSRSAESDPWSVGVLDLRLDDGVDIYNVPPHFVVSAFVDLPLTFSSSETRLPEMVQDSHFRIDNISMSRSASRRLVRVEFSNRPGKTGPSQFKANKLPEGWNPIKKGWVILDPERFWTICEFQALAEFPNGNLETILGKHEYEDRQAQLPLLKRKVLEIYKGLSSEPASWNGQETKEFESIQLQDLPDNEFTLTGFGFPEPKGVVWQRGSASYLWFILVGVLGLTLGYVLRRWARKWKTKAAAEARSSVRL